MADLRKENVVEGMEEKHYLVMPFNNKMNWYFRVTWQAVESPFFIMV